MDAVAVPGEEGEVAAEDDQRAVQHVDDVEHAPHERKADGQARVERAQHDAVHQGLQIRHRTPATVLSFRRREQAGASPAGCEAGLQAQRPTAPLRASHASSSRHLISAMSPFLMSAGASTLIALVLHLDDRQVAGLVHAVGAELDRPVERADVGLRERIAHLLLVGGAGPLDRVLQEHGGRRARGMDVVRVGSSPWRRTPCRSPRSSATRRRPCSSSPDATSSSWSRRSRDCRDRRCIPCRRGPRPS